MNWDYEQLTRRTPKERHNLWENAKRREEAGDIKAKALKELIETSGLDYKSSAEITLDSPIGRKMERVIFGSEGKHAALDATKNRLPALAGVDPLLSKALGADYGSHNAATIQAGYLVKNMMLQLGYEDAGPAPLPPGCVAKTGRLFRKG